AQTHGASVEIISLPWRTYASHLKDNFSYGLLRRLKSFKCDILLQDELNHPSLLLTNFYLNHPPNYPIISITHHLRSSENRSRSVNSFYRMVEKLYLKSVHGFIFNSESTRDSVKKLNRELKPYVVSYPGRKPKGHGIDFGFIRKRALNPGPLRLLFVGALIPRKELHTLLKTLSLIPKKDWSLRIVGSLETDKAYTSQILELSRRLELEKNITLLGSMSEDELEAEYRHAHTLVVPSSYEGFGIVYLESMGFGVPPLASTAGAAHEIITDGLNGFLVSPGDTKSIAEKIRRLVNDRDLLVKMGEAALDRFMSHPTWEQSCEKIFHFMTEMIGVPYV
ncbi:MAG: glycosyltransferase family 4 protein, partial [Desulfomonilaceae bacterium]